MPANAPQRLGPRSALPPASTGYEIAQVVKAAPTDPYSSAAAGPSKANDLLQSLGILDKTIAPLAAEGGKLWAGEQKKKGAEARFVGDARTPNASNAFIDGYERMDGQYKGIAFGNAAKEYALKNSHLKADEFQDGLNALQTEYTGQLVHQGQLDTFLPDALKGGEHAASIYQEAKNAEITQERDAKVTDIHTGKYRLKANQLLAEIAGIPLKDGIDSVGTNPVMRARFEEHEEEIRVALSAASRQIMEESVTDYKVLGISPRDARANLIGVVGRIGGNIGKPSLNDFMHQKDASGRSPAMSFPDVVDKFSDQARAMDTQINTANLLKQEREKKAGIEKRVGDWQMELSFPGVSTETAQKIWLDVWNDKDLPAEKKESLANHAADVMLGMGFALKDNQMVSRNMLDRIMTGKVSGEAAYTELRGASHQLSQPTYQHLLEKAHTITNKKGDTEKERGWQMFQSESNTYKSALIRTLGLQDEEGKIMIGLEGNSKALMALSKVTTDAVDAWYRGIEQLTKKAPGGLEDNIDRKDLKALYDHVIDVHRPRTDFIANTAKNPLENAGVDTGPETAEQTKQKKVKVKEGAPPPSVKTGKIADLTKLPDGIPAGYTPTGKLIGGKKAWVSADGKMIEVEK